MTVNKTMTFAQFFRTLRQAVDEGKVAFIEEGGAFRSKPIQVGLAEICACPISALATIQCGEVFGTSRWIGAAERLGLDYYHAKRIADAADYVNLKDSLNNGNAHTHRRLRHQLRQAIGVPVRREARA
jgi:hypothetical protein